MTLSIANWLAQVEEDAIEPELEVVDAHHHLFNAAVEPRGDISLAAKLLTCCSPGLQVFMVKMLFPASGLRFFGTRNLLFHPYRSEDLKADFGGHNVVASVAIEAQWNDGNKNNALRQLGEAKSHFESMKRAGYPNKMSIHIDLNLGKAAVKDAIKIYKEAVPDFVVGLRHQLAWNKHGEYNSRDAKGFNIMKNANWLDGFSALEEEGLLFEAWVEFEQLQDLAELAQNHPKTEIVLNHCGTPLGTGWYSKHKEQVFEEWKKGIEEVAKNPNVFAKLSGLNMPGVGFGFDKRPKPPTSDEVTEAFLPYMSVIIANFGTDRCLFASNFPVDKVSSSYSVLFNAFKKVCQRLEIDDEGKKEMFAGNAKKLYKI